jgi:hypothetical protein
VGSETPVSAVTAELREAGSPFGTTNFPVTAAVLPAARAAVIEEACRTVMEAFDVLINDVCSGDRAQLGRLCRVPEHELPLWDVMPSHDWALIARPDVLLAGDRTAVIEVNAVPPQGHYVLHDMVARAQRGISGLVSEMDALGASVPSVTAAFADTLREHLTGPGVLAISYWAAEAEGAPLHSFYGCLVHELAAHGIDAWVCPVEDLEVGVAGVRVAGKPVSAVFRCFDPPSPGSRAQWEITGRLTSLAARGRVGLFTGSPQRSAWPCFLISDAPGGFLPSWRTGWPGSCPGPESSRKSALNTKASRWTCLTRCGSAGGSSSSRPLADTGATRCSSAGRPPPCSGRRHSTRRPAADPRG